MTSHPRDAWAKFFTDKFGEVPAKQTGMARGAMPKKRRKPDKKPDHALVGIFRGAGLPALLPEYHWHPKRAYRADYALVEQRILIEIDGGLFVNGGHSRGAARLHDMAKDREAVFHGWRTLRYSPADLFLIPVEVARLLGIERKTNADGTALPLLSTGAQP